ncbi:hypothetical protein [Novosphingobium terrae]|uniref:hypothetical protein n=1 Tax=Novosphingobium terrae TaxID=2726189 RepID=UPI001981F433|nr:hypothetical protein [Novosphingobium terrae]
MELDFAKCAWVASLSVSLAVLGWLADRRRLRRADPDAVGWVPWRGISFWATMVGVLAAAGAVKFWMVS